MVEITRMLSQLLIAAPAQTLRLEAPVDIGSREIMTRNNQVMGTGGSSDAGGFTSAYGICVSGRGLRILNNDVSDTRINASGGQAYGIVIAQPNLSVGSVAVNNHITDAEFGLYGAGVSGVDWGKFLDNITVNVTTPYTGGTDIGNNH